VCEGREVAPLHCCFSVASWQEGLGCGLGTADLEQMRSLAGRGAAIVHPSLYSLYSLR
jgi:hypothetical protein